MVFYRISSGFCLALKNRYNVDSLFLKWCLWQGCKWRVTVTSSSKEFDTCQTWNGSKWSFFSFFVIGSVSNPQLPIFIPSTAIHTSFFCLWEAKRLTIIQSNNQTTNNTENKQTTKNKGINVWEGGWVIVTWYQKWIVSKSSNRVHRAWNRRYFNRRIAIFWWRVPSS